MTLGFSEIYATWLPCNLEYLNSGSVEILKALEDKDFERVRYSTIVSIRNQNERNTFDLNI
mgnify:CR=1 FL=1